MLVFTSISAVDLLFDNEMKFPVDEVSAFSGGSGTREDPYLISNITELQSINEDLSSHYILTRNIDASETSYWNQGRGFIPLGSDISPFTGELEGNGFHIRNLLINHTGRFVGLFGYIAEEAIIKNLTLFDLFVRGMYHVGGISGYSNGDIINCRVIKSHNPEDELPSGWRERGVGDYHYSCGILFGMDYVGGIAGYNTGTISNCSVSADVIDLDWKLDEISRNNNIDPARSNSEPLNISTASEWIGGIVGVNSGGSITYCYSEGSVSGEYNIGGIAGDNIDSGNIGYCYSTSDLLHTNFMGRFAGLVGYNGPGSQVFECYSAGRIADNEVTGGLVSVNDGTVSNCFFDHEKAGTTNSTGGIAKNTGEMMNRATFTGASWDMVNVWDIDDSNSYPYFKSHRPGSIIITEELDLGIEDEEFEQRIWSWGFRVPGYDKVPKIGIESDAPWLSSIGNETMRGTPANKDVGEYSVYFQITDDQNITLSRNFPLMVININDPPVIQTENILDIDEDIPYFIRYIASDIDPTEDIMVWSLETDAEWLYMDPSTGWLNGTPENRDVGLHRVNVSVSDPYGGVDLTRFVINVSNVNDDPVIDTVPTVSVDQDSPYLLELIASDADPGHTELSWSMRSDAEWLVLNGTLLHGTPLNSDVGESWVELTVTDGDGGSDTMNFTLVVVNINDVPVWTDVPDLQVIEEGVELRLTCSATDVDVEDDLTYSIWTDPGTGIHIDARNGEVLWGSPVVGYYSVIVSATDGIVVIKHEFTIVVEGVPDQEENYTCSTTDTDSDGMPNWWEEFYGLDPMDPSDAILDADNDSISNIDEFLNKTSPLKGDLQADPDDDDVVDNDDDVIVDKGSKDSDTLFFVIIAILAIIIITLLFLLGARKQADDGLIENDQAKDQDRSDPGVEE